MEFTFDRSRPLGESAGERLRRPGGGVIGPTDTVSVAMAAFPACEGGDGYKIPEAAERCGQASSGPRAADLLVRYVSDSLGGRITAAGERPDRGGRKPQSGVIGSASLQLAGPGYYRTWLPRLPLS